jgi:predicted branched-subunit amino acid permease
LSQRERSLEGLKVGGSIAIGYFPVAMAFGFAATEVGLNIPEAMLFSVLIFAGASQFAMFRISAKAALWLQFVAPAVLA